jgi:hypothetical protein
MRREGKNKAQTIASAFLAEKNTNTTKDFSLVVFFYWR